MYFRVTIPSLKEGAKEEAMSFMKDTILPDFSGIEGLLSLTAMNAGENSLLNITAWDSKEAVYAQEEKFKATMAAAAQFFAAPPEMFEGDAVFGKVYQSIAQDEKKPAYMRLVIGMVKDKDAALANLKDNVEPIYDESNGLQVTGAIYDGDTLVSWNIWDTEEDMKTASAKLQEVLDLGAQRDLFDGDPIAFMGPVYTGKLFVDFNKGESPTS
jgi:hypothetical protein